MTAEQASAPALPVAGEPRQVPRRAVWLLAPNPGPMTFDGTNSWALHGPAPVLAADHCRKDRFIGPGELDIASALTCAT